MLYENVIIFVYETEERVKVVSWWLMTVAVCYKLTSVRAQQGSWNYFQRHTVLTFILSSLRVDEHSSLKIFPFQSLLPDFKPARERHARGLAQPLLFPV